MTLLYDSLHNVRHDLVRVLMTSCDLWLPRVWMGTRDRAMGWNPISAGGLRGHNRSTTFHYFETYMGMHRGV